MTGADSPVMADSSTVAIPSTTSPSPGITSPAVTTQRSPTWRAVDARGPSVPSGLRTLAIVSALVLRSVAAWALPRPSAIASAKLANRTVNHRKTVTTMLKTFSWLELSPKSRTNRIVVKTEPISTTNITGLRAMVRGLSFLTESTSAVRTMAGSNSDRLPDGRVRTLGGRSMSVDDMMWTLLQRQVFDDWAQRQRREEGEAGHDRRYPEHQAGEQPGVGWKRAGGDGHLLLAHERSTH